MSLNGFILATVILQPFLPQLFFFLFFLAFPDDCGLRVSHHTHLIYLVVSDTKFIFNQIR